MLKYKLNEDGLRIEDERYEGLLNDVMRNIIHGLQSFGYQVRIVGGAVRDIISGDAPRDVDFITNAKPDEIMFILTALDIQCDVKGIKHGTVKAVVDDVKYDVSSIDFHMFVNREGEIKTLQSSDWEQDAKRRDFTVNSLSMDLDGNVFDYTGGIKDLENEFIRPLGVYEDNIKEDAARLIRFFKMVAKFDNPRFSKSTLDTIAKNAAEVKTLSHKRIKLELINIMKSKNANKILDMMKSLGVLDNLIDKLNSPEQQ